MSAAWNSVDLRVQIKSRTTAFRYFWHQAAHPTLVLWVANTKQEKNIGLSISTITSGIVLQLIKFLYVVPWPFRALMGSIHQSGRVIEGVLWEMRQFPLGRFMWSRPWGPWGWQRTWGGLAVRLGYKWTKLRRPPDIPITYADRHHLCGALIEWCSILQWIDSSSTNSQLFDEPTIDSSNPLLGKKGANLDIINSEFPTWSGNGAEELAQLNTESQSH